MNPSKTITLPEHVKPHIQTLLDFFISLEKQEHKDVLQSFSHRKAQIQAKGEEYFSALYARLTHAQKLIKKALEIQNKDAIWQLWENAQLQLRNSVQNPLTETSFLESPQEISSLSWEFCDAAYLIAKEHLMQKQYQEAADIFFFLYLIQPNVFEYTFGQATAEQALLHFEEAIACYVTSLTLRPENPVAFYQIAQCLLALNDKENGKKALQICIEHCKQDETYKSLLEKAKETLR